jgi:hypothetical protein
MESYTSGGRDLSLSNSLLISPGLGEIESEVSKREKDGDISARSVSHPPRDRQVSWVNYLDDGLPDEVEGRKWNWWASGGMVELTQNEIVSSVLDLYKKLGFVLI